MEPQWTHPGAATDPRWNHYGAATEPRRAHARLLRWASGSGLAPVPGAPDHAPRRTVCPAGAGEDAEAAEAQAPPAPGTGNAPKARRVISP